MPLPDWFPQRNPADQPIAILKNFVYHTKVPVTNTSIEQAVKQHPAYPHFSLQTLAQLLQAWGIETLAVDVKIDTLPRIYYPAIAHIRIDEDAFVLLYQLTDQHLLYLHPRIGWIEESMDEFAHKWQGKLLLAIPVDGCGEPDYDQKKAHEMAGQAEISAVSKVKLVPNFLSSEECNHIIEVADSLFTPSQVVDSDAPDFHKGRTSFTAMLTENKDAVLQGIYERAAELLSLSTDHLEYGQCVSYIKGQEYQAHFDTLDERSPLGRKMIDKYGQRLVTMLVYLNDDFEGGETFFPTLDYKIQPRQGTAVIFINLDAHNQIDKDALHAGLPVFSGRKYAFNLWGWTRPFRLLHS